MVFISLYKKGFNSYKFTMEPSLGSPNFFINRFINRPRVEFIEFWVDHMAYKRVERYRDKNNHKIN
jgi:hypothetical protein